MVYVEQMISLGMCPEDALSIQNWFFKHGDIAGLEEYIERIKERGVEVSDR